MRPNYDPSSLDSDYARLQQTIKDFMKLNIFTAIPVKVRAVNDNKVDLLPVIEQLDTNGDVIEITDDDLISNIPVMMLFGGNCQISFKPAVNDLGLLIACKYDIANYVDNRTTSEVASNRIFSLANGFYLPLDFQSVDDKVLIKNATSTITLTSTAISISNTLGQMNIDATGLIQIKNTAQSLFTLLNTLITTLISLKTGTTPATASYVIDTATVNNLATLQSNLALLLKA